MIAYRTQLAGLTEDVSALLASGPDFVHQAVGIVQQVGPYLPTIRLVVEDPALPQVAQRIQLIRSLEVASAGGNSNIKGIGLSRFVPLLDAYIFYRQNETMIKAVGIGAVALGLWAILRK